MSTATQQTHTTDTEPRRPDPIIQPEVLKWIEDGKNSFWRIVVLCPHCGKRHYHGGGNDKAEPLLGHRCADCGGGGYTIERRIPTMAERTDYPELFKAVSWGHFKDRHDRPETTEEIIANRNAIGRLISKPCKLSMGARYFENMDHRENYRLRDGRFLCIVSNYDDAPDPAFEMERTGPLYSMKCQSYVGIYTTRAAFNKCVRRAIRNQSKNATWRA